MAPEMALGEGDKIGPASDVYLLGGILYEIVTGLRPHTGRTAYECIVKAMANEIAHTDRQGERVDIALKAMATAPDDRYPGVKDFQQALRYYQEHAESLKLSMSAGERLASLDDVAEGQIYRECTEIIAAHQQALELWSANRSAIRGLRKAREHYTQTALDRGDLALAQSQVQAMTAEVEQHDTVEAGLLPPSDLADAVTAAVTEAARKERAARATRGVALMAGILVVVVSLAAYFITRRQRDRALAAEASEAAQRRKTQAAFEKLERENYHNVIRIAQAKAAESALDQAEELLWSTPSEAARMGVGSAHVPLPPGLADVKRTQRRRILCRVVCEWGMVGDRRRRWRGHDLGYGDRPCAPYTDGALGERVLGVLPWQARSDWLQGRDREDLGREHWASAQSRGCWRGSGNGRPLV